jgi:hypothetical protein
MLMKGSFAAMSAVGLADVAATKRFLRVTRDGWLLLIDSIQRRDGTCELFLISAGVPSEYELGNFDQVKREIVDFCENEMEVHEEAKDTVVHDWLKGEKPRPRRRRSSSANASQRKPSTGTPVRNNMSLNY